MVATRADPGAGASMTPVRNQDGCSHRSTVSVAVTVEVTPLLSRELSQKDTVTFSPTYDTTKKKKKKKKTAIHQDHENGIKSASASTKICVIYLFIYCFTGHARPILFFSHHASQRKRDFAGRAP